MRFSMLKIFIVGSTLIANAFGVVARVHAQNMNGTLSPAYGSALCTQTINTAYGNNTVTNGTSSGGSEFDAAYGLVTNGNLYVFLAGNFQDNANRVDIFIADGRPGESTFYYPSGSIDHMNSSEFSPGFQCTFAMDLNLNGTSVNASEYLVANGNYSGGAQGAFTISGGIGSGAPNSLGWAAPITIALDNTNAAGVSGSANGTAANQAAAAAVITGYELSIPLSILGNPTNPIKVLADINGTSDNGPLSNQWLPGLPVGTSNFAIGSLYIGTNNSTACFNFSSLPDEFFTVAIPEPSTMALVLVSGLVALLTARRRGGR